MHIPDGFLDLRTTVGAGALAAACLAAALRSLRSSLLPRQVPLIGLTAAFVFAAQMLNFPIPGGTSGHLLGAVLVVALLGPAAAVLVMSTVLVIQALLFADGGVFALGANITNMGVLGVLAGYFAYAAVCRCIAGIRGQITAAAFAGWCSVVAASVGCALQLSFSGTVAWQVALPAMTLVHMLIGAGEALITALVLVAIWRTRPELLQRNGQLSSERETVGFLTAGAVLAVLLALVLSPYASSAPDGLDRFAETAGFAGQAIADSSPLAFMADYRFPGVSSPKLAVAWAGGVGTVLMFVVALALGYILAPPSVGPKSKIERS